MKLTLMWISLILLIVCSAFFSSSETALSSMNRIRMKHLYENGNKKAGIALRLFDNFNKTLTAILIGNNVVNIGASTIATLIFTSYMGTVGAGVSTVLLTMVILIFGEITPKSFAKDNSNNIFMKYAKILSVIVYILTPLIFIFDKLKNFLRRFNKQENDPLYTEQELKVIIGEVQSEGVLEEHEGKLVKNALDFDETTAEEAMVPRVDVVLIEIKTDLEKIKNIFIEKRFSRIPVYEKQIDNIVGILSEKDFFSMYLKNKKFKIEDLIVKPLFVPPQISMTDLLRKYKEGKTHMAIVIDQYGGVDGIITMENVFEELMGDISDQKTKKQIDVKYIGKNSFLINPDISCEDMFEKIEYNPKNFETQSNTVGGWVLEKIKKVPKKGDSFVYDKLKVNVIKVKGNRMTLLKVEYHK